MKVVLVVSKLLIIGNGFDLAHKLPTKYKDFFDYLRLIDLYNRYINQEKNQSDEQTPKWPIGSSNRNDIIDDIGKISTKLIDTANNANCKKVVKHIKDIFSICKNEPITEYNNANINEVLKNINNNFWYEYYNMYFYGPHSESFEGENWFDFEDMVSKVIQFIDDKILKQLSKPYSDPIISSEIIENEGRVGERIKSCLENLSCWYVNLLESIEYTAISEKLYIHLNKLIRCLEIYLCSFVKEIQIHKKHPIIEEINLTDEDIILNFNYTNTFYRVYDPDKSIQTCHIHGEANISNTIEKSNLVIGINEYLRDESQNRNTELIDFRKRFQILSKKTIHNQNLLKHRKFQECHIFGHSLDVSDKYILEDIITNSCQTIVYYIDDESYRTLLKNLVKLIGMQRLTDYMVENRIIFKLA